MMSTDGIYENPNADVFVYRGEGGVQAPRDVVRLRVDPSVTSIPDQAFFYRNKLIEVELCEGLIFIGRQAFDECDVSIRMINIPTTLRWIDDFAFYRSLRTSIRLHDDIESIGEGAFGYCIFTNFRVPSLITVIPASLLQGCNSVISVELPEIVTEIENGAFEYCYSLRNVAFPPDAVFGNSIFMHEKWQQEQNQQLEGKSDEFQRSYKKCKWTDLQELFGSEERIVRELRHRFDELPVHSWVYYQSYHEGVLQRLLAGRLDPTGNQQDCLGMTPLHILACSSVHDLEMYRVIVERYPTNLITEDGWGALPLLYALWGAASTEIIQLLLDSYQSLYPDHIFNWTMMVETLGRRDTPKERIENLLCVKQIHFPEQPLDWEYLLVEFALSSDIPCYRYGALFRDFRERMQFLFMCGMSEHVRALPFTFWRDHITSMIQTANFGNRESQDILGEIREKLAYFQAELSRLEEATTILELTLWTMKVNEKSHPKEDGTNCHQKKMKTDESSFRSQCRVTCGADVVIQHVLPFLL